MKRYRTPRIVQPDSTSRYPWLLLLLVVTVVAAGWALRGPYLGWVESDDQLRRTLDELDEQRQLVARLTEERAALQARVAGLERAGQVDREATRQVQQQLVQFEQERAELEQELEFLRSMVSSKDERNEIRIQRFKLERTTSERRFRYSFTLTQNISQSGVAAVGSIFLAVDGTQDGEPRWLPLRELTEDNTELLKMRFKHFQDLEGVVQLPEGFTPRKMIVEIKPNSKKLPAVKERFDWAVAG